VTQLLFLRHVGYCGIPLADNQLPRATPTANTEVAPSTETDEGQQAVSASNCETVQILSQNWQKIGTFYSDNKQS
jgi:hypothetical protein